MKETVKTIAQGMPDDCGVPLVADACAFLLHRRPRVQRASGIPCALGFSMGMFFAQLGRHVPRGSGLTTGRRHCEERQRRSNPVL
jgi:hypothetical protein